MYLLSVLLGEIHNTAGLVHSVNQGDQILKVNRTPVLTAMVLDEHVALEE
jgi:hypothetical protein